MMVLKDKERQLKLKFLSNNNILIYTVKKHMINILIVDDHRIVREGLKKIIQLEKDMVVAGQAKDASEAIRILSITDINLIILDISLPE